MKLFTDLQYVKIDIANNYGLDKLTYEQRLAWFDQGNIDLNKAEKPILVAKGLEALNHLGSSNYLVGFDACSSGPQILSAMIGCVSGLHATGCIDQNQRMDCYSLVRDAYYNLMGIDPNNGKMTRKDFKGLIMPAFYGSKGYRDYEGVPGEVYDTDVFVQAMNQILPSAFTLIGSLTKLLTHDVTHVHYSLPDGFEVDYDVTSEPQTGEVMYEHNGASITVPFTYTLQGYTDSTVELAANITHSIDGMLVREITCRMNPSRYLEFVHQYNTVLRPNYVHSTEVTSNEHVNNMNIHMFANIDSFCKACKMNQDDFNKIDPNLIADFDFLVHNLPDEDVPLQTIHDCFYIHPRWMNRVRKLYNKLLSQLVTGHVLEYVLRTYANKDIRDINCMKSVVKLMDENKDHRNQLAKAVLEANYSLT